jgi:hypothetical protein
VLAFGNQAVFFTRDGTAALPNRNNNNVRLAAGTNGALFAEATSCVPGEQLYAAAEVGQDDATGYCYLFAYFYRGDGTQLSAIEVEGCRTDNTQLASGNWRFVASSFVVPVGTASVRLGGARETGVGNWYFANPSLGRQQPGADVTAAAQVVVASPPSYEVQADYQGNVTSGLPLSYSTKVSRGGVSIHAASTTTYAINPVNCTAGVDNGTTSSKGVVTVTAMSANSAYVDIAVTVSGVQQPPVRLALTKIIGAAPVAGGSTSKSASDSNLNSHNATTFVALTDVLTVGLAAGERLHGTAPLEYVVNGSVKANRIAAAKWQYRVAGQTAWSDVGAAITGSVAISGYQTSEGTDGGQQVLRPDGEYIDTQPGYGQFSHATGALSAGTYEVQLVASINSTGRVVSFYGTALIEAKP